MSSSRCARINSTMRENAPSDCSSSKAVSLARPSNSNRAAARWSVSTSSSYAEPQPCPVTHRFHHTPEVGSTRTAGARNPDSPGTAPHPTACNNTLRHRTPSSDTPLASVSASPFPGRYSSSYAYWWTPTSSMLGVHCLSARGYRWGRRQGHRALRVLVRWYPMSLQALRVLASPELMLSIVLWPSQVHSFIHRLRRPTGRQRLCGAM